MPSAAVVTLITRQGTGEAVSTLPLGRRCASTQISSHPQTVVDARELLCCEGKSNEPGIDEKFPEIVRSLDSGRRKREGSLRNLASRDRAASNRAYY